MPLDMEPDEFRRLAYRAVDILADRLARVREDPVRRPLPEALRARWLAQPLPIEPVDPDVLLESFADDIGAYPMGNESPRFFAWVNSPPAPFGVIAELLAAGMNPSVAGGDHAATSIERAVLRWLALIVGFPAGSGGVLTSGGSVATLVALAVMRHVATGGRVRQDGMEQRAAPLIAYASNQGHSCVQRAVELLGFGAAQLRQIEVDAEYRLDPAALRRAIAADRAAGLRPAAVVASAGTVNTGAIDPLGEIADLCSAERLWLHVDGAYGACAILADSVRPMLSALARADSIGLDPHKWLSVPVECGCVLVRDAGSMRDALSLVPPYLRDDTAQPWLSEFTIQQTRGFRALKLWMLLQQVGTREYGRAIERDIGLARALQERIRARPHLELVASGPLSITCFRYAPPGAADLDRLNREVAERLQREGRVFLTTTQLPRGVVLRACSVNFRTQLADLDVLLDAVEEAGRASQPFCRT